MNLQVDLMFDNERRSGSSVSRKFVIRLAAFIVPVVLLGLFMALVVAFRSSRHDRKFAEQEHARIDPEYKKVMRLESEYNGILDLKMAVQGCGESRADAYRLLRGLQRATPLSIQLTRWIFNEQVKSTATALERTAGIFVKGKVAGASPETDVQKLYQALKSEPPFSELMAQVEVKRFTASAELDEPGGRIFDIECNLMPRQLVRPAGPAPGGR